MVMGRKDQKLYKIFRRALKVPLEVRKQVEEKGSVTVNFHRC